MAGTNDVSRSGVDVERVGLVLTAAEAMLWEQRADWLSGKLAWFEVARLVFRVAPSR
jgi:hypothetical protein